MVCALATLFEYIPSYGSWQKISVSAIVTVKIKVYNWRGSAGMEDDKPNGTGLGRIYRAMRCSILGFKAAFTYEAAFRQELLLVAVMVPAGLWLGNSGVDRALLVSSLFLVLIVEVLNSAVEAVVDRIGSERHELAGRAKDLGSAAVFLALSNVAVVWLLVLL